MTTLTFKKVDATGKPIGEPMTVPYAPAELAFAKTAQYAEVAVPGLEQPIQQFVRGNAETLTLELFFDSTAEGTGAGATGVTSEVEAFHRFVSVDGDLHTPPLVRVSWGQHFPGTAMGKSETAGEHFTAVVLGVGRRFTLFSPDGVPLRATVSLSLRAYATMADQIKAINFKSADHTRLHIVAEGETLPLIAHDAYADAGRWRLIADHNDLVDVRDIQPGDRLELPPLVSP